MEDLCGKKLLILGANPETVPLVEVANSLGIKTLVTSNIPNDAAKKVAWKACNVDGLDIDGLIQLAKAENVDGILVGVADILVPVYCKVCEALDLPCYATQKIVDVFSYKDTFKETCEKYGIHGIPEYRLDENLDEKDIEKMVFPVMVKPVDGYSGVGMTVCYEPSELKSAVEKALRYSKCKRFIVCLGGTYPSKHIDTYFERMHDNAVRMFREIGINNGVLMLSAFYEDEEFYVYDTGFRLQGEAPHLLMKAVHGFDQREMLIRFALTGSEGDIDLLKQDDARFRGKWAATVWYLLKAGTISEIKGLENITDDRKVVANIQRFDIGDTVISEWIGTEKQVFSRLYLVCESKEELTHTIEFYRNNVKVLDATGNNMLLSGFDVNRALEL